MAFVMVTDYLIIAVAIAWLVAACISDIRKREVANWLNFSLLAFALGIRAIGAVVYSNWGYFIYGLLGVGVFWLVAEIFYSAKIFGGGDAKLLMASGAVFATAPSFANASFISEMGIPFLGVFFFNLLLAGSVYGVIYSIVLAAKNKEKFFSEFGKIAKETGKKRIFFLFAILLLIIAVGAASARMYVLLPFVLLIAVFPYFFIFVKAVENACMLKMTKPSELTEGDWLVHDIKIGKNIIKAKADGLSIQDIKLIAKARRKILIKQGMPFVPSFLIAAILSLLAGNILEKIVLILAQI